jgi:hypothetical protein
MVLFRAAAPAAGALTHPLVVRQLPVAVGLRHSRPEFFQIHTMYYLLMFGAVMLFLSFVAWRDAAASAKRILKIGERRG